MADIPTNEPLVVTAGDTIEWKRTFDDYPASAGWVLTYALRSASSSIDITASADVDDHLVSITAATSAAYVADTYSWQAYVTKGIERFSVDKGTLTINPDFAAAGTYDNRTHVKKVLDAIEAALESRASKEQLSYTINGRALTLLTPAELMEARSRYQVEYRSEQAAERIANGLATTKRVGVRF